MALHSEFLSLNNKHFFYKENTLSGTILPSNPSPLLSTENKTVQSMSSETWLDVPVELFHFFIKNFIKIDFIM